MNFQKNIIHFRLTNIWPVDEKMNKAKKDDVKIKAYEKWKFSESIQLWYLLSAHHSLPLWNMENNMVTNEKGNVLFINIKLDIC